MDRDPGHDEALGPYNVVAIVGPTASGKSAVADRLAARLGSLVVSADAMQVYRRMDIGTAKTPVGERSVELRCVDLAEPGEVYSVALYAQEAHKAIDEAIGLGRVPVVCGGTGLYVRAALEDMQFPSGDQLENPVRRQYEALAESLGPDAFHKLLAERDPESAALIHPNNVRRVVRAFELLEQGSSYAREHETLHVRNDRYPTLHIGMFLPREVLYSRINDRVDAMVEAGLLQEVERLMDEGFTDSITARQAIGYKELVDVVRGKKPLADGLEEIKQSTRRYAKRQMTWFRADKRIKWLDALHASADDLASAVISLMRTA